MVCDRWVLGVLGWSLNNPSRDGNSSTPKGKRLEIPGSKVPSRDALFQPGGLVANIAYVSMGPGNT